MGLTVSLGGDGFSAGFSDVNLVFIVAFALLISFLAMYLARRGGRRK